ncbi:MAG: hypothetical protein MUP55_04775 [Candidatus Aenigmarchaeota archaeon]|nr:hypothetical protein [Candidatus Aenigmarchaeota archaeon]
MSYGIDLERADKWFRSNILRYVSDHPGEILILTENDSIGIEEVFLKTEEDINRLFEKYPKGGRTFLIKSIPRALA